MQILMFPWRVSHLSVICWEKKKARLRSHVEWTTRPGSFFFCFFSS